MYIDKLLWPDPKQLDDAQFDRTSSAKLSSAHQILRAYCLALVKCCDLVLAMVTSQHYYEVRPPMSEPDMLISVGRRLRDAALQSRDAASLPPQ